MKRIGLTQRVEVVPAYGERRDCLDQNWTRLVALCGFVPVPLSNSPEDPKAYFDSLGLSGVILTGGNDIAASEGGKNVAPERDAFEYALIDICMARRTPVLGVCRGLQILNVHLGGRLRRIEGHTAVRHTVTWEDQPIEVNSFHAFAVSSADLAEDLTATAICADRSLEAFHHKTHPIVAVMWHPERGETDSRDLELIRVFFGAGS